MQNADQSLTHYQIFSVEFEDSRNHEVVLRDLPNLWFDGKSLQVWPAPFNDEGIPRPKSSPDRRFSMPVPPLSPPSTKRKETDMAARESSSPTPSRPFSHIDKLPMTPPRTNQALERLLQGASPTPELLAAVKTEKSKWELYEQALLSTPGSRVTSNLFRVAQYSSPNTKSAVNTTPISASKLVSFNSMKSPSNINREELREAPVPMKGQDSVRYKQEVPHNFRFSLERLQRGELIGSPSIHVNMLTRWIIRAGFQDNGDDKRVSESSPRRDVYRSLILTPIAFR
jgi:hypothetical protein